METKVVELVMCTGWANGNHYTEVDTGMSEEEWLKLSEDEQFYHLREEMDYFISDYISVSFRDLEG